MIVVSSADSTLSVKKDKPVPGHEYKYLMIDVSMLPVDDQIDEYKRFLFQNPHFSSIYLKLLDAHIQKRALSEAAAFFQKLEVQSKTSQFASWMLAKINIINYEMLTAEKYFRRALSYEYVPLKILLDVIQSYNDSSTVVRILKCRMNRVHEKSFILAMIAQQSNHHDKAVLLFESLIARNDIDPFVYTLYGDSYFNMNCMQKADSIWRVGTVKAQRMGSVDSEAELINRLGNSCNIKMQFDQAFNFFDKSDSIAFKIGNIHVMQINATSRGNANFALDKYETALLFYKKAIQLTKAVMDNSHMIILCKYIGWTLIELNRFSEALEAYSIGEMYALKQNDHQNLVDLISSQAALYDLVNHNEIALEQFNRAYRLSDYYKFKALSLEIASQIETIKVKTGDYRTAIGQYLKYIQYLSSQSRIAEQANWTGKIADVYRQKGNIRLARVYCRKAVELFRTAQSPIYQAWYKLALADLEALEGRFQEALLIRQQVESMARAGNKLDLLADVQIGFGNDYFHLGDDRRAAASYRQAIHVIETTRERVRIDQLRMGYFSPFSDIYRKLTGCFGRRAMTAPQAAVIDSVLIYFLAGRERVMRDKLTGQGKGNKLSADQADTSYRQACIQLQAIQRKAREMYLDISADSLRYLQARIEASRYSVLSQKLKANGVDSFITNGPVRENEAVSNIKELLRREKASLLLIHISESTSFLLALNEKDTALVRLKTDPKNLSLTIDSLVSPFHHIKEDAGQNVPFRADLAFRLYMTLIRPVESVLRQSKNVIVLPDDALLDLPFEMLLDREPIKSIYTPRDPPDYADAFLLHRFTFRYSPISRADDGRRPLFRRNPRMRMFANPYRTVLPEEISRVSLRSPIFGGFEPLPFAELEAERIRQVCTNVRVFERDQATEKRFTEESRKADVLHLATHAFFDSTFQAFSGLALAETNDPADDGFLMGYEIADMDLDCDLVALSACETGRGKRMAGEGILGLPRIFLGAGARSVLMTFWKVDDRFTSMLMPAFYDGYLNRRLTKAEALAESKRSFFNKRGLKPAATNTMNGLNTNCDYRHPFYWASFMLFGEQGHGADFGGLSVLMLIIILVAGMLGVVILQRAVRKRHQTGVARDTSKGHLTPPSGSAESGGRKPPHGNSGR